jgi:hypothetical protein
VTDNYDKEKNTYGSEAIVDNCNSGCNICNKRRNHGCVINRIEAVKYFTETNILCSITGHQDTVNLAVIYKDSYDTKNASNIKKCETYDMFCITDTEGTINLLNVINVVTSMAFMSKGIEEELTGTCYLILRSNYNLDYKIIKHPFQTQNGGNIKYRTNKRKYFDLIHNNAIKSIY